MQQNLANFIEWTQKYSTQEACLEGLNRHCWKKGFICLKCRHDKSYQPKHRHLHEFAKCDCQVSPVAGTVFELTRLLLSKWFTEICLMGMGADKGGISVHRLSKMPGESWPTAYRSLRILRKSMEDWDRGYWLKEFVEVGDAFVGGCKPAREGRTKGKKPVIFAVRQRVNGMGFRSVCLVERVSLEQVRVFSKCISPHLEVRTDAFKVLWVLDESERHEPKATQQEKVDEWLLKVHIVISNFKSFMVGTFHAVSHRYLQKYIDEFVIRFNRRFWQSQLLDQLL